MPFYPHGNFVNVRPTGAAAQTSATYVMAGFGVSGAGGSWFLTPQTTGRVLLLAGGLLTSGTTASTCTVQLSFGTGTAPSAGAAAAGTQQGNQPAWVSLTGALTSNFFLSTIVTGLTIGTQAWFDIAQKSSGGTLSVTLTELTAIEI